MAGNSGSKGMKLSDLNVDDDKLIISYSCNDTAEQKVRGKFKGLVEVDGEDYVLVNVTDGKPLEAVPRQWIRVVERIRKPDIISHTT